MITCTTCKKEFPASDPDWEDYEPEVCPSCAMLALKVAINEDSEVKDGDVAVTGELLNFYMNAGMLNEWEVGRLVLFHNVMTSKQLFFDEVAASH